MDYMMHCKAQFGSYCKVFNDPNPTNTMVARTQPAVCLGPTRNLQGTYKFFALNTGRVIKRRQFKELPMPKSMVKTIESLDDSGSVGELIFANNRGKPYTWNRQISTTKTMKPRNNALFPALPAELPGIIVDQIENNQTADIAIQQETEANDVIETMDINREVPHLAFGNRDQNLDTIEEGDANIVPIHDTTEQQLIHNITRERDITGAVDELITNMDDVQRDIDDVIEQIGEIEGQNTKQPRERRSTRTTRGRRTTKTYEEEYQMLNLEDHDNTKREVKPMSELQITEQLAIFKTAGEDALKKELTQLHDMNVFIPVPVLHLSEEQKCKALSTVMFIKQKSDNRVKGQVCADGRKQHGEFSKEEAASPTVTNESVFMTGVIDAKERRDVATVDITGAYLHAVNNHDVHMILKGKLAELMEIVAPHIYRKHITTDNRGQPILYVHLHKALYGLLKSALLFYKKLSSDLKQNGFTINPYDPCVANKQVNGAQMTVVWHVDNLKISHKEYSQVTNFIKWLGTKYNSLTVHHGKTHDYLGMDFDYSTPGVLTVSMAKYVNTVIDGFPELITGTAVTPAADHLFKIREPTKATVLPENQAIAFHHTVAQLLFLSTRARRDIQTPVEFLTTRVREPDEDDWGKLKCVLKYLNGTKNMKLQLEADAMPIMKWWVDASHATHDDCKSHTGAATSLGKGMMITMSRKQKINGKSSTESELIGVDDALPNILWTKYFLECQGYDLGPSVLYQDNKSALLLETNGLRSASKRTKHIKVQYFFIKDKVEQGEIKLHHCPTEEMWADILTKPKQGKAFHNFCNKLMNHQLDEIPTNTINKRLNTREHKSINVLAQECVDACTKNVAQTKNNMWPVTTINNKRWDPNVYVKLLTKGLTRSLACAESFIV